MVKDDNVDILINNAGYGLFGSFDKTSLKDELNMIDLKRRGCTYINKIIFKRFVIELRLYIKCCIFSSFSLVRLWQPIISKLMY